MPTKLSININKVALLRNSRHNLSLPDICHAAIACLDAGADGITIHPRPDERHIRHQDVFDIAEMMQDYPDREFNIEGNPLHNLMDYIRAVKPHQATFVPDTVGQFTSDHGWDMHAPQTQLDALRSCIDECKNLGVRVSLFMDPIASFMPQAKALGANRVELYTESWARAYGTDSQDDVLQEFIQATQSATDAGLSVNAGHDLNCHNLRPFLSAIPNIAEVSIGHAFIADALDIGYKNAVIRYLESTHQTL